MEWERKCYSKGIPDHAPIELEKNNLVPSYRRICMAILKNDIPLKSLGFTPKESIYYGIYKRIELQERNKSNKITPTQLKLF